MLNDHPDASRSIPSSVPVGTIWSEKQYVLISYWYTGGRAYMAMQSSAVGTAHLTTWSRSSGPKSPLSTDGYYTSFEQPSRAGGCVYVYTIPRDQARLSVFDISALQVAELYIRTCWTNYSTIEKHNNAERNTKLKGRSVNIGSFDNTMYGPGRSATVMVHSVIWWSTGLGCCL